MPSQFHHGWDFLGGGEKEDGVCHDFGLGSLQTGFDDDEWGFQNEHGSFGGEMQGSRMFDFLSDTGAPSNTDAAHMHNFSNKLSYFNQFVFPTGSEPVSPSSAETTPTSSEQPIAEAYSVVRAPSKASHSADDMYQSRSAQGPTSKRRKQGGGSTGYTKSSSLVLNGDLGRKKKYDAPPGVWRNSGGFISTVYINKKRVYGPLRRDVNDAVRDREEMSIAKTYIRSEEGMRAFVSEMKTRSGPGREMCTDFSAYDSFVNAIDTSRGGSSCSLKNGVPKNASSRGVVRAADRPVRAAAKRNLYIGSEDSAAMDDDEEEEVEPRYEVMDANFENTEFQFM